MPEETSDILSTLRKLAEKHFNLLLLAVIVFALILRLKYMTINAAVWWDEADYLSLGKHFGLGTPEIAAPWRARAIPMLWGIFYFLGANEWIIRLLEALMGVLGVYLTFVAGKIFFSKWTGLFAAFMLSVYHEHLFWGARISLDVYVLVLWTLASILFWKALTEKKTKYYIWTGLLYGAGIYAYESIGFIPLLFLPFLLFTRKVSFIKDKKIWLIAAAAIIAIAPFAAYHYIEFKGMFGEDTNFIYKIYPRLGRLGTTAYSEEYQNPELQRSALAIAYSALDYFKAMPFLLKWPFFIALLLGITVFADLALGINLINKEPGGLLQKKLYILLWILAIMLPMGFLVATSGYELEPRLIFPAMPALFMVAGAGVLKSYDYMKKYSRYIGAVLALLLLIMGAYSQLTYADSLINARKDSFFQHKFAGEWLKARTVPGNVIVGCGLSVNILYYSERKFMHVSEPSIAEKVISENKPKYVLMDAFDPACIPNLNLFGDASRFNPVQAYFMDKEQKQPIMVIYEVIYNPSSA